MHAVGRIVTPEDAQVLISGTCRGKGNFADVMKDLKMERSSWMMAGGEGGLNVTTSVL